MRVLPATADIPGPLPVQYGLYARDARTPAIDAVIDMLMESLPAAMPPNR